MRTLTGGAEHQPDQISASPLVFSESEVTEAADGTEGGDLAGCEAIAEFGLMGSFTKIDLFAVHWTFWH